MKQQSAASRASEECPDRNIGNQRGQNTPRRFRSGQGTPRRRYKTILYLRCDRSACHVGYKKQIDNGNEGHPLKAGQPLKSRFLKTLKFGDCKQLIHIKSLGNIPA